jgi:hypothetical protein
MSRWTYYLPEGHHWDLHIEHHNGEGAGGFTGGGWKFCWHITVSPWDTVDSMVSVLDSKRAAPHFVIGGRDGLKHPVVVQMLALNEAGRALAHPSGPETNRANVIQCEICATPESVKNFTEWHYKAFANLVSLTNHRVEIPVKLARRFVNTDRFSGPGFVNVSGHLGHMHVPGNDHFDPTTSFKGSHLLSYVKKGKQEL